MRIVWNTIDFSEVLSHLSGIIREWPVKLEDWIYIKIVSLNFSFFKW